jgi:predicted porin
MRSAQAQTNFKGDFGMQKKLLAVAVAGALAAPGIALAQTSTVQIYGALNFEYGWADQGTGRPSVDYSDTPGGSNIGFKGEEKLGGNLSAWFQCESSADVRGYDQTGFCTRNSAVGLKGGFGNAHFGRWDTPMKRALGPGSVGAIGETGILGMSFLPWGGSGGADATVSNDGAQRQRWKRREAGLLYYESPNFSGFQVLAAFSAGNAAADGLGGNSASANGPATDLSPNPKPRVWSLAGTYNAGPLSVGLGYERHADFGAHQGAPADCSITAPLTVPAAGTVVACGASTLATIGLDDDAWSLSAAYTFMGTLKVGFTYLDADYEMAAGQTMGKKTWTIGAEWNVSGPHTLFAMYANADDTDGISATSIGGNGGITSPCTAVSATGVCTPRAGGTGGDAWHISYQYAFSKRTSLGVGYTRVSNDSASNSYRIGNTAAHTARGEDVDGFALLLKHRF